MLEKIWHIKWINQTEVERKQCWPVSETNDIYTCIDIHTNVHMYVNPFTYAVYFYTYIIKLLVVTSEETRVDFNFIS